ncbi:MAG: hypothetical protein A2X81_05215 [Desulfobacterales bacterium GWB2_56_26]|nr:MAG: hypothetical protein A2X81_05215 [Desulfobacterales bacterium GWB2_56_26]
MNWSGHREIIFSSNFSLSEFQFLIQFPGENFANRDTAGDRFSRNNAHDLPIFGWRVFFDSLNP